MLERLLDWLKSWFATRDQDGFRLRERQIYSYSDGQAVRRVDPVDLYRKWQDVATDLDVDARVATSPSKDARAAEGRMMVKLRAIFDVKPFAAGGLTDGEVIDLFVHFREWVGRSKKNSPPPPTSPAETSGPTEPPSGGNPPTPSGGGSGSTASEPPTEEPVRSPAVLPSETGW